MTEPVRLVIWDLDETFWAGTLTEGGIRQHIEANYEIVRTLAQRGIMSSICSKNDFETIKALLQERGIWDYFIFPSIDWTPKGPRIQQIIEEVQLRPETILFIDDNPGNRGEAATLVPGLQVSDEHIIPTLLDSPLFKGKDDSALKRLTQYKLLESKSAERGRHASDVEGFLRGSAIKVEIDYDIDAHQDRIIELINRTNQLNFTKKRLSEDIDEARAELHQQIGKEFDTRAGVVKVKDRFGDYGVVGFFLISGHWNKNYLIHFVFSCRTLGMGVEQWVYEKLGRPGLHIIGEVIAKLDSVPDWINQQGAEADASDTDFTFGDVRLKGGCELEVLAQYFSLRARSVSNEFVFQRGVHTAWRSHSVTLFPQPELQSEASERAMERIGLKAQDLSSNFLSACSPGTLLVLSASGDFIAPLFRHKELGFQVPVHVYGFPMVIRLDDDRLAELAKRMDADTVSKLKSENQALHDEFARVDFDEKVYVERYRRILDSIPDGALLVILLPLTYSRADTGEIRTDKWLARLNAVWRREAEGRANVRLVDCAEAIQSDSDFSNSNLHLSRQAMHRVYRAIGEVYEEHKAQREGRPSAPERSGAAVAVA